MNIFDALRKSFAAKSAPDLEALKRLMAQSERDLQAMRAAFTDLEASRPAALLGGDAARLEHRRRIDAARLDIRDLEDVAAGLGRDIAAAERVSEQDRRRTVYAAAVAEREAAVALFMKGYEPAARAIAQIIEVMARADLAIQEANSQLPDGTEPLAEAEITARLAGSKKRHVISRTRVEKWVEVGSSTPIDDNLVPRIEVHPKTGRAFLQPLIVAAPGYDAAARQRAMEANRAAIREVERMEFWRVEEAEAVSGILPMPLRAITLPGARGGDADIWSAVPGWLGPGSVLMAADEREAERWAEPQKPMNRTSVRLEPISVGIVEDAGKAA